MTADPTPRRWPVLSLLFSTHLVFLGLGWIAFVAICAAVTAGIATVGEVTGSVVDAAASILRWFALGYGTVLTGTLLPTHIAHGQTRRDAMVQLTAFILVGGTLFAALITATYALEGLLYRLAGWPHALRGQRLFTSSEDFALILLTFCGVLLTWTIAGALLSAAFYRSRELGVVTIPLALVLVGLTSVAVGYGGLPFVGQLLGIADLPLPMAVALCAAACALGLTATWALVRTLPLRTAGT